MGCAYPGEKESVVVVDLSNGTDCRTGVAVRGFLVDRDRGGETLDTVDIGLLHHPEKLARVGREGLHVATLSFGIDRVECEGGLARTRESRKHDEAVARDVHIQTLEIVLPCTFYLNVVLYHFIMKPLILILLFLTPATRRSTPVPNTCNPEFILAPRSVFSLLSSYHAASRPAQTRALRQPCS